MTEATPRTVFQLSRRPQVFERRRHGERQWEGCTFFEMRAAVGWKPAKAVRDSNQEALSTYGTHYRRKPS